MKKILNRPLSTKERWIRKIYDEGIRAQENGLKLSFVKEGKEFDLKNIPCHYQMAWYMLRNYQKSR